jgi:hypothetical protein
MNDCETCEINISEELLPTLDHLAACPSCQAFYRDVRALAAATGDPRLSASAPGEAPEEVWRRIEEAEAPALSRTGRARPWAMRLAAAVLLVAGLAGALASARSVLRPAGAPIEVTLGEDRGRMTEQRFVDLTVELLRADSRYRQEMFQVLTAILERDGGQESPVDQNAPLPEGDEGESDRWRPAQGARRLS